MQVLPEKKWVFIILFFVISVGAILWQQIGIKISNANINVLVCMPFFLLGVFLKSLKNILNAPWFYVAIIMVMFGCTSVNTVIISCFIFWAAWQVQSCCILYHCG